MTNNINCPNTNSHPVYHAPLIIDADKQRSFRKWGHVAWPNDKQVEISDVSINKTTVISFIKRCIDNVICLYRTAQRN